MLERKILTEVLNLKKAREEHPKMHGALPAMVVERKLFRHEFLIGCPLLWGYLLRTAKTFKSLSMMWDNVRIQ